jgi:hypothetical protein
VVLTWPLGGSGNVTEYLSRSREPTVEIATDASATKDCWFAGPVLIGGCCGRDLGRRPLRAPRWDTMSAATPLRPLIAVNFEVTCCEQSID